MSTPYIFFVKNYTKLLSYRVFHDGFSKVNVFTNGKNYVPSFQIGRVEFLVFVTLPLAKDVCVCVCVCLCVCVCVWVCVCVCVCVCICFLVCMWFCVGI